MAATFAFIDHAFIDRKESRRNIRQNVMKCKESGKMRSSSPSRLRLLRSKKPSQAAAVTTKAVPVHASHPSKQQPLMDGQYGAQPQIFDEKAALPEQPKVCPKLNVHVGNGLSGLSSACEMNAQSRRIVHDFLCYVGDSLHPAKDCKNKPDPNMTIWFQYMLVDEAYFHCFVALSEACLDFAHGKEAYSSEYRHHICMALKLINDKLSSDKAVADTNLAGVIALCLLSSLREQPVQTKIHFDGLCKMIEVRGGMQELAGNPALVEKALRIDIDLALQLGCATRLGRSAKTLDAIVPIFSNPAFEVRSPLINAVRNADQEVLIATEDIMKVSRLFNSGVAAKKLGPHAFQDIITTTCYQLLDIRPIEGKRCDMHPVANAIHLALLAFMTTFLIQFGRQRRLRYELISRKLMKALDNPKFQAAVDPATHLWLLVMTGISVLGKEHRVWLKPRLSDAIAAFGVDDWKFAKRLLSKYPWIGDLHDEPAAKLWQLCFPANDDGH